MRKILLTAAAFAALVGPAVAADLPSTKSPAAYVAQEQPFNWTGFYVGVEGGADWANTSGPATNASGAWPAPYRINSALGLLGGYVGYNYQSGSVVFGLEGNFDGVLGGNHSATVFVASPSPTLYNFGSKETWTGDIRGRLGYALNRALLYVAGGVAFGDVNTSYAFSGSAPYYAFNTQRTGFTIGGGVDYAFTNNWIGRVEYRYTDLGVSSFVNGSLNAADKVRFTSSAVLVGLSYKFGVPAPIVAKY